MKYKMEELVPVVAKLAQGYTAGESTSITYERAQQLMEAVLYCINEGEREERFSLMNGELSPEKAYDIGAKCVEEKTKHTLFLYNEVMVHFDSYENECLYDTVAKGLPEFFRWYDLKYEPQNTILTLDYPVLTDNREHTGINKIYDYVICIQLEQKFLNKFPHEYVVGVLSGYNNEYRLAIDNICEIVLMNLIFHILAGKDIENTEFDLHEYKIMQEMIQKEDSNTLHEKLKGIISVIIQKYYENDRQLMEYLSHAIDSISVRLKIAADNENLAEIF